MRNRHAAFALLAGACILLPLAGCQSGPAKHEFHVKDGVLHKGDDDFKIKAFEEADLLEGKASLDTMVPALCKVASAGGRVICYEMRGFNPDGTTLDPSYVEAHAAVIERVKEQSMAVLCRVVPVGLTDAAARRNAARTAGAALRGERRAVYLLDGPDGGELARIFKDEAPDLVVVAPENGDLGLTTVPPDATRLVLLTDTLPKPEALDVHFVLPGTEAMYAGLDDLMRDPEENEPWSGDAAFLTDAERAEGFVPMHNAESTGMFYPKDAGKTGFVIDDEGALVRAESDACDMTTRRRFGDFVLRFDYKIVDGGNSGIHLRAPRAARASRIGFEFQILGDHGDTPTETSTGAVYDVLPALQNPANPSMEWNSVELTLDGPRYKALINGEVVQDLNFDEHEELKHRLREGFIRLTDHDHYVAYRNIRIKEL